MDTFKINPKQVLLEIEDSDTDYIARFHGPQPHSATNCKPMSGRLLGYIRYSKQNGTLELTNFKAQLGRQALKVGFTTKRQNSTMAGTHGEGLKAASLVLLREGYQIRFEASKFYWNFRFAGGEKDIIYCFFSTPKESTIQKQIATYQGKTAKSGLRELKANLWEDISVKIGKIHASHGKKIELSEFKSWLQASLDLSRPQKTIETDHGILILDPNFRGRMYLKSLLLEVKSVKKWKFGYNFFHGYVNRDRQKSANASEEARALARIWEQAIEYEQDEILDDYVSMLREDTRWSDVNLAKDYMSERTARRVWQRLKNEKEGNKFYHDHKNGDGDVQIIRSSLKKEPVQLPTSIWTPLRRYRLVRTPQEEQHHLLHGAPIATITETPYVLGVKRALSAALALRTETQQLNFIFKSGDTGNLLLLVDQSSSHLLIHEDCFHFKASHVENPCWLSTLADTQQIDIETFSCDHIVTDLYDLILNEFHTEAATACSLRLKVGEKLREMPRKIESAQGSNMGAITVSWVDGASNLLSKLHGLDVKCRITLHRESTCSKQRFELLASGGIHTYIELGTDAIEESVLKINTMDAAPTNAVFCGCPHQIVSQKKSTTAFSNLDPREEYFPMMASVNDQAFFGLPPARLRPKESEISASSHLRVQSSMEGPAPYHAYVEDCYSDDGDNSGNYATGLEKTETPNWLRKDKPSPGPATASAIPFADTQHRHQSSPTRNTEDPDSEQTAPTICETTQAEAEQNQQTLGSGGTAASLRFQTQQFQGNQAANERRIKHLEDRVQQLQRVNETLKGDLKEAQKDALDGHASTRAAPHYMINVREPETRLSSRMGETQVRESSEEFFLFGLKRNRNSAEESSEPQMPSAKRMK